MDILVSPKVRMLKAAIFRDRPSCSRPARASSSPVSLVPLILEQKGEPRVGWGADWAPFPP